MDYRAQKLKEQGNARFAKGDYAAAEGFYSSAIVADPAAAPLYTNRARCRLNTKQFDGAIADCEKCIALEPKNFKAPYILAKAHLALGDPISACDAARAAYDMCRLQEDAGNASARSSLDMTLQLFLQCRRARWESQERARKRENDGLEREVLALLAADRDRALAEAQGEMERGEIQEESARKAEQMAAIFERSRAEDQKKRELPDWLLDDISFNVMVDPVITKTGRSYERASVMAHLKNHPVDPLTREPLDVKDLRPNIALKQACESFLENNGWAYDW